MSPAQFRFLYLNANLIAELALQRFDPGETSGEPHAAAQPGADPLSFDNVDLSALDGLDELIEQHTRSAGLVNDTAPQAHTQANGGLEHDLRSAYGDASLTEARRDELYAQFRGQADRARFEKLIAALPAGAPSLASPLTAAQLEHWLRIYRAGHDTLDELIISLRALGSAGRW